MSEHLKEQLLAEVVEDSVVDAVERGKGSPDVYQPLPSYQVSSRHIKKRLQNIASGSNEIELIKLALLLSAEVDHNVDLVFYLQALDQLVDEVSSCMPLEPTDLDRACTLSIYLSRLKGLTACQTNHYDPENSFVSHLIDSKRGSSTVLAILYSALAQRLGLPVRFVNFPDYYLLQLIDEEDVFIDPVLGKVLTRNDCESMLSTRFSHEQRLLNSYFSEVKEKNVLIKLLDDLKKIYLLRQEFELALRYCDYLLILLPDNPLEVRDRAMVCEELNCLDAAIHEFERFIRIAPHNDAIEVIEKRIVELRQQQITRLVNFH